MDPAAAARDVAQTKARKEPRWVPDNEQTRCMLCERVEFGMFQRRHHCRCCGRVVCAACQPDGQVRALTRWVTSADTIATPPPARAPTLAGSISGWRTSSGEIGSARHRHSVGLQPIGPTDSVIVEPLSAPSVDQKVCNSCVRQHDGPPSDGARRLCGARQRRAFATSMLASVEVAVGLRELPYDLLRCVCEAVAALGPPPANLVGMMPQLDELVYSL